MVTRRQFVAASTMFAAVGVAGCSGAKSRPTQRPDGIELTHKSTKRYAGVLPDPVSANRVPEDDVNVLIYDTDSTQFPAYFTYEDMTDADVEAFREFLSTNRVGHPTAFLYVRSVAPRGCYAIGDVVMDTRRETTDVTVPVQRTATDSMLCTTAVEYPAALVALTFEYDYPADWNVTIVDGWGVEETFRFDRAYLHV